MGGYPGKNVMPSKIHSHFSVSGAEQHHGLEFVLRCEKAILGIPSVDLASLGDEYSKLIRFIRDSKLTEAEDLALELFRKAKSDFDIASVPVVTFLLHVLVAISELQFDLRKRTLRLTLWNEIPEWIDYRYSRCLRTLQNALSAFYPGHLQTAEPLLRHALRIIESPEDAGGPDDDLNAICRMRVLFHLGLVHRDLMRFDFARSELNKALGIARKIQAEGYATRIAIELAKIVEVPPGVSKILPEIDPSMEIDSYLRRRDFVSAASIYIRNTRRIEKTWTRFDKSLHMYLPLILLGLGKARSAEVASKFVDDPVLRLKVLELKRELFELSPVEKGEVDWLRGQIGVSNVSVGTEFSETWLMGRKIDSLESAEVRIFVRELIDHPKGLTKERICEQVWGIGYDPVVHDPKVHKLAHRLRNEMGCKQIIVNTYGGYRLNPDLITNGNDDSNTTAPRRTPAALLKGG